MASNFDKVKQFHEVFCHPKPDQIQTDIFLSQPRLVDLRLNLIREEVAELESGVKEQNLVEVIDALADILYVVYGMGVALGINLDQAFKIVHESNMSKLCRTEEEAKETVEHYQTLAEFKDICVSYKKCHSPTLGTYYVMINTDSGKILKSKYYNPANFTAMLSNCGDKN